MRTAARLVFVTLLGSASIAAADIPPEPGYVEACDIAYYPQEGQRCDVCADPNYHDVEACARRQDLQGFSRCCRTAGATTWREVWCEGTCPEPDVPDQGGGCAVGSTRRAAPWLAPLALGALVAWWRRRA